MKNVILLLAARLVLLLAVLGSLCAGCRRPPSSSKLPNPLEEVAPPSAVYTLTYSYEIERNELGETKTVEGTGTAFGIEFRGSSRYLLTAAHCVISGDRVMDKVKISVGAVKTTAWVVKIDPFEDVALLKAVENLPQRYEIAETRPVDYMVLDKDGAVASFRSHVERMQLEKDIEQGMSGSPVIDPPSGAVIGMLIAKIASKDGTRYRGQLITSMQILKFLKTVPENP